MPWLTDFDLAFGFVLVIFLSVILFTLFAIICVICFSIPFLIRLHGLEALLELYVPCKLVLNFFGLPFQIFVYVLQVLLLHPRLLKSILFAYTMRSL